MVDKWYRTVPSMTMMMMMMSIMKYETIAPQANHKFCNNIFITQIAWCMHQFKWCVAVAVAGRHAERIHTVQVVFDGKNNMNLMNCFIDFFSVFSLCFRRPLDRFGKIGLSAFRTKQ